MVTKIIESSVPEIKFGDIVRNKQHYGIGMVVPNTTNTAYKVVGYYCIFQFMLNKSIVFTYWKKSETELCNAEITIKN